MRKRLFAPMAFLVTVFVLIAGLIGSTAAQDATPAEGEDLAAGTAHPAHIHMGSCGDTLGDVVYPLNDVALPGRTLATPGATPEAAMVSTPATSLVASSTTTVDVSIDDLLASEHAINVHESMENIGNYIACGNITGTPDAGVLDIELEELNDSGYTGQATLVDHDGSTTVTITIQETDAGTPEATPAS